MLASYSKEQVVYINFEDERIPLQVATLTELLPTIQSVFGQKPTYLFLDELQNIPNWSKWLRRILDNENIKLFVTGSSSKMSSFELPTELRGRCWETKVFPLTLKEFFRFKGISIDLEKLKFLPEEKAKLIYGFDEFLFWGSLPEIVFTSPERKQELLQSYFQTVVRKEIIERFGIKNETALKTLLKLLLNSTYFTVSKLHHNLKSLGISTGKTTINNYLSYIESSYFLKQLYFYSPSMINQLQYPRKNYFIDNGFITSLSTKFSKNYSRLFENLIYWQLTKENEDIYYYKDKYGNEVDFVIVEGGKTKALYQVCYDLTDFETKEREIRSLKKAGRKLNCKELFLIVKQGYSDFKKLKGIKIISPETFLSS